MTTPHFQITVKTYNNIVHAVCSWNWLQYAARMQVVLWGFFCAEPSITEKWSAVSLLHFKACLARRWHPINTTSVSTLTKVMHRVLISSAYQTCSALQILLFIASVICSIFLMSRCEIGLIHGIFQMPAQGTDGLLTICTDTFWTAGLNFWGATDNRQFRGFVQFASS